MTVQMLSQYGSRYRAAAQAVIGIDHRPTIAAIAPGGSAEQGGLRPGDVIAAIDGQIFAEPARRDGKPTFADVTAAVDVIDAALADGAAVLSVIRAGSSPQLTLGTRPACRARFDVRAGRSNNASADGLNIQVSSDLIAQVRNDGEIAAILAHELAHNILEHPLQLRAATQRPSVRSTEIEADRLSGAILDAAGYSIDDAVAFWTRWGKANDHGIFADGTHPKWRDRIATIKDAAAAHAAARQAGASGSAGLPQPIGVTGASRSDR